MEEVVVIGAGWAGLAAAHRLRRAGVDPLVLEQTDTVGGATRTCRDGGWLLEAGPHAFFPHHPVLQRFLQDAGGADDLMLAPLSADRYVTRRGRRVALPRSPPGILSSRVLSFGAKLRLLVEPFIPARHVPGESVAAFTQRRFGSGVNHLVDAMVSGVFAGDPARLSAEHAFPRVVEAERKHGNVLKGIRHTSTPRGRLAAPRMGMGAWLGERAIDLRVSCGERVHRIEGQGPFQLISDKGSISARRVLLAVPPDAAAALLGIGLEPLPRAPVATIGLGWTNGEAVRQQMSGYGVLNPAGEDRFSLGVLYESALFPDRAPPGGFLVRALVGGRRHPERVTLRDEELVAATVADVMELHGLQTPPDWTHVLRPPPIPQLEQGHDERLAPLLQEIGKKIGMASAGWGWRGIGISDVVHDGRSAAGALLGVPHPDRS